MPNYRSRISWPAIGFYVYKCRTLSCLLGSSFRFNTAYDYRRGGELVSMEPVYYLEIVLLFVIIVEIILIIDLLFFQ